MTNRTETLLQTIQQGGPLSDLFRRASTTMRAAIEATLAAGHLAAVCREISAQAHARLDAGVQASPLTILRQCGAGCNACCHTVSVDVTPLEALVLAAHLRRNVEPARLAKICERLNENAGRRAAMSEEERSRVRLRCGLLGDDGLCQAYEARPLVCAGVFSLSRSACETAAMSQELASQQIPLDRPAKAWTMGISGGLQRALVEAGLDGNLYELNSIVLCALDAPDAAERWLRGEDVFAGCICTDAHSPPRCAPKFARIDPPHDALRQRASRPPRNSSPSISASAVRNSRSDSR